MKLKEYDSYIFDLDGTLFIIPVDWLAVRKEVSEATGEKMEGTPLFLKLQRMVAEKSALRDRLLHIIDSYELRAVSGVREMDGASELLSSLFEVARLALVTMQGRRACDEVLRQRRLGELFEAVVTREQSMDRAEQLDIAMKRIGAKSGSTLFTGDRLNDVVCATKVGVDVALIGDHREPEPRPTYRFRTLEELRAYLT